MMLRVLTSCVIELIVDSILNKLQQAGKQLEYLTGGHVLAGFHEVVVTEPTQEVISKKKAEGE